MAACRQACERLPCTVLGCQATMLLHAIRSALERADGNMPHVDLLLQFLLFLL